jgi:kynurenine formamidase
VTLIGDVGAGGAWHRSKIGRATPAPPIPPERSSKESAMATNLTEGDVIKMISSLSNWGRWGADDQLGTMNLITPATRKRAAALVQDGVPVSCARPIVTNEISADTTIQPVRFMVDSGEGRDHDSPERILQRRGAAEFIGMVFHGYSITHVDTPAHYFWQGKMYNGRSANLVTSREGAQAGSVDLLRDGVVSRGVLLDIAALKGRWLEAGEGVMLEDLEAAEQAQGVRVEPGDILLIRTGYYARRLREARNPGRDGSPAAHVASMPWFRARDIAMLGSDTHNDVSPLSHPGLGNVVHIVGLVGMGLWLIDNGNLEESWRRRAPRGAGGSSCSRSRRCGCSTRRARRSTRSRCSEAEPRLSSRGTSAGPSGRAAGSSAGPSPAPSPATGPGRSSS